MKKWTYLVAACMLAGTTPVITGCVDTDEPAGIEQLRGAKAELLRAKAAVEQAKAVVVKAYEAYVAAMTREKNAVAEQEEMLAQYFQLLNEYQQLENDEKRAEVEKRLAEIQQEMEENALAHEKEMVWLQQQLAVAQQIYDQVMQQIAIAKALGLDDYNDAKLTILEDKVKEAYDALYVTPDVKGKTLEDRLYDANEKLHNALQNKLKGYDTDKEGGRIEKDKKEYWPATLEAIIAEEEAALAEKQAVLDKLEEIKALPVEDTDWVAELDALQLEIDEAQKLANEKEVELSNAKASTEYLTAWQNVYGVYDFTEAETIAGAMEDVKDAITGEKFDGGDATFDSQYEYQDGTGTLRILRDAESDLEDAKKDPSTVDKKLSLSEYDLPEDLKITDEMVDILGQAGIGSSYDNTVDQVQFYFHFDEVAGYNWTTENGDAASGVADWENDDPLTTYPDEVKNRKDKFEEALKKIAEITPTTPEQIAQAENQLKYLQSQEEAAKKVYDDSLKVWQDVAQAILDGVAGKDYPIIEKSKITEAKNDYNTAYKNLQDAIEKFNVGLDAAYKAGEQAAVDGLILDAKVEYFNNAANDEALSAIAGFNLATARENLNKVEGEVTNEAFEKAISDAAAGNQTAVDAVMKVINDYVAKEYDEEWEKSETVVKEKEKGGHDYVSDWMAKENEAGEQGEGYSLDEEINKAAEKLEEAYESLRGQVEAYKELAWKYAQKTANAKGDKVDTAEDALNLKVMVGEKEEDSEKFSKKSSWVADLTQINEETKEEESVLVGGQAKKKIQNTEISDAEFAAATKVTYNAEWESDTEWYNGENLNAMQRVIADVFGILASEDSYYWSSAPSMEDILNENFNADAPAYKYYNLVVRVEAQQDIIACNDDMKAFAEAIQKELDAFMEQVKADYNDAFGELEANVVAAQTAYDTAQAALDKVGEQFAELETEVASLNNRVKALNGVASTLKKLVYKYLGVPEGTELGSYDPETFAIELDKAIAEAQKDVADAQQAVQEAKVNLDQANSGEYDGVAYFQFKLDQVQREWDKAYKEYQDALADVETALDVIAANAE